MFSNKFEVLTSRVMNVEVPNRKKVRKDRRIILRKEKLNKERKN